MEHENTERNVWTIRIRRNTQVRTRMETQADAHSPELRHANKTNVYTVKRHMCAVCHVHSNIKFKPQTVNILITCKTESEGEANITETEHKSKEYK